VQSLISAIFNEKNSPLPALKPGFHSFFGGKKWRYQQYAAN
jgi:hypothetical protein